MTLGFKRGRDVSTAELYYKLLLYGDSGGGKTWLAATAPDPVILLTERNGEQSIRLSAPDAPYVYVSNVNECREFLDVANDGAWGDLFKGAEFEGYVPRTLVVDGLTEIQRLIKDSMQEERGDGEFSIRDWGLLNEKVRGTLRMLRDMPYNVVATALAEVATAEEIRYVRPAFQGKQLPNEAAQFFNAVGYVYKRPKGGARGKTAEMEHVTMFDGPARTQCKSCYPLGGQRVNRDMEGKGQTVADWFDELRQVGIPDAE